MFYRNHAAQLGTIITDDMRERESKLLAKTTLLLALLNSLIVEVRIRIGRRIDCGGGRRIFGGRNARVHPLLMHNTSGHIIGTCLVVVVASRCCAGHIGMSRQWVVARGVHGAGGRRAGRGRGHVVSRQLVGVSGGVHDARLVVMVVVAVARGRP